MHRDAFSGPLRDESCLRTPKAGAADATVWRPFSFPSDAPSAGSDQPESPCSHCQSPGLNSASPGSDSPLPVLTDLKNSQHPVIPTQTRAIHTRRCLIGTRRHAISTQRRLIHTRRRAIGTRRCIVRTRDCPINTQRPANLLQRNRFHGRPLPLPAGRTFPPAQKPLLATSSVQLSTINSQPLT